MAYDSRPAAERFWQSVRKADGDACWLWTGGVNAKGYGRFDGTARCQYVHRYSFEIYKGPIPQGMCVLHRCDTPNCVNPDHLFLGTRGDNNRDRDAKGRTLTNERHPGTRLSVSDILTIRRRRAAGEKLVTLAAEFAVDAAYLSLVVAGKRRRST